MKLQQLIDYLERAKRHGVDPNAEIKYREKTGKFGDIDYMVLANDKTCYTLAEEWY